MLTNNIDDSIIESQMTKFIDFYYEDFESKAVYFYGLIIPVSVPKLITNKTIVRQGDRRFELDSNLSFSLKGSVCQKY